MGTEDYSMWGHNSGVFGVEIGTYSELYQLQEYFGDREDIKNAATD